MQLTFTPHHQTAWEWIEWILYLAAKLVPTGQQPGSQGLEFEIYLLWEWMRLVLRRGFSQTRHRTCHVIDSIDSQLEHSDSVMFTWYPLRFLHSKSWSLGSSLVLCSIRPGVQKSFQTIPSVAQAPGRGHEESNCRPKKDMWYTMQIDLAENWRNIEKQIQKWELWVMKQTYHDRFDLNQSWPRFVGPNGKFQGRCSKQDEKEAEVMLRKLRRTKLKH